MNRSTASGLAKSLLCVALLSWGCEKKPGNMFTRHDPDHVDYWFTCMEIWKCDDGMYEVKSDYTLEGRFATLGEAQAGRTNWALRMIEFNKNMHEPITQKLPTCGKRIE